VGQLWIASKESYELRAAADGAPPSSRTSVSSSSSACLPARPRPAASTRRPLVAACARPFRSPNGGERSSQIQSCLRARTFRSFGWVSFWFP